MRFGWLAAAAAMVCAVPAGAQRYVEFNIHGIAFVPVPVDTGAGLPQAPVLTQFDDTLDFTIDVSGAYAAAQGQNYSVIFQNLAAVPTGLATFTNLTGPLFSFNFSLGDVAAGSQLAPLAVSNNNFAYRITYPRGYVASSVAGTLLSVSARSTDVAPSSFAVTETLVQTAAVPELASWAMMIVGMGAIGFALRRQSRGLAAASIL